MFFKKLDPRVFAIEHPIWTVVFAGMCLVASIPAGVRVFDLRGGILDDTLPVYDEYHLMDRRVAGQPNFNSSDAAQIVVEEIDFGARLKTSHEITKELETKGYTIVSLATAPDYKDTGDELLDDPYLTSKSLASLDTEQFRRRVFLDSAVADTLIGPKWVGVGVIFPAGFNEVQEAWRLIEHLEGRSLSTWERFFKKDIKPERDGVMPIGWIFIRWLIDQCLNSDMITLVFFGVILASGFSYLALGSIRQALLIAFLGVGASIWFTRAMIAPVHAVVPGFYEFVYTILAYANIVVQGTSLSLHKLKAFRATQGALPGRFRSAFAVDGEMVVVALIAITAFMFLNVFPLWQLRVMGYQSIMGVVVVFLMATIVIPAVYILLDHICGKESEASTVPMHFPRVEKILTRWSLPSLWSIAIPLGAFMFALFLGYIGKIATYTAPLDYIKNTGVWRAIERMKDQGSGTDMLPVFVTSNVLPRSSNYTLDHDVPFLQQGWDFQKSFRDGRFDDWQKARGFGSMVSLQATNSVLDSIVKVSWESYHHEFPATAGEMEDILRYTLPSGISKETRMWLWNENGFRLSLFTNADDSIALGELTERVQAYAREMYPALLVDLFGKVPVFPRADYYIHQGVLPNIAYSMSILFVFYGSWLWWERRRSRKSSGCVYAVNPFWGACILALPFPLGLGIMGVTMSVCDIGLSMATVPITDLAVNAGNDFSVYIAAAYLLALRLGKNPKEAAKFAVSYAGIGVILDCGLNMSGFAPLAIFSNFEPIRDLGWMMLLMLASCCFGAIYCVPVALQLVTVSKKEVRHDEADVVVAGGHPDDGCQPALAGL